MQGDLKNMNKIEDIRKCFPALQQQVYGKPLVYLDNGATSQKPQQVIDLINQMNKADNANVHRAMHKLSDNATILYETARDRVKEFINAPERENIIFTSGASAAINLVASCFGGKFLQKNDVVIISEDSHHSNIVPWQLICERVGAQIRVLPIKDNGEWDMEKLPQLIDNKVKIIAATHISNILGLINPVEQLITLAHKNNIPVLLDGAQGIVHKKIDVQSLDCDFYIFSGHKIYAATGTGVLYGKKDLLEAMPPYMGGGDMVDTVSFTKTTYAPLPLKYEAGTPNFIGQATFTPALNFAQSLREGEWGLAVAQEEQKIMDYMIKNLQQIKGLTLYGNPYPKNLLPDSPLPSPTTEKIPIFSFNIEGCFAGDIAQIIDKMGIAVRSGLMCAEPLMSRFGVTSMVRASFLPYNTLEEAKYFISSINRSINMLR